MKRYEIKVGIGSTGFGITEETNSINKATRIATKYNEITNRVEVFDNEESRFIYMKKALDYKPTIDEIN